MVATKLVQVASRRFSTTIRRSAEEIVTGYKQLKLKQEHFQKNDGLPVYRKGGGMDGLMYRGTMGLCALALISNFSLYYYLAYKK